jgi:RimJ/RimL family protein N-acetyltransferase
MLAWADGRAVSTRFLLELDAGPGRLRAREPTRAEVAASAPLLCGFYNEPHNAAMLAHTQTLTVADVVAHYRRLAADGARGFLLEVDGRLVGDADLRGVARGSAEAAILVGDRALQGRGLGTRFGVMVHAFAFEALRLARVYASILPANAASLRLFEKLGYETDDSPAARRRRDEPGDLTLSLPADRFARLHGALAAQVRIAPRRRAR